MPRKARDRLPTPCPTGGPDIHPARARPRTRRTVPHPRELGEPSPPPPPTPKYPACMRVANSLQRIANLGIDLSKAFPTWVQPELLGVNTLSAVEEVIIILARAEKSTEGIEEQLRQAVNKKKPTFGPLDKLRRRLRTHPPQRATERNLPTEGAEHRSQESGNGSRKDPTSETAPVNPSSLHPLSNDVVVGPTSEPASTNPISLLPLTNSETAGPPLAPASTNPFSLLPLANGGAAGPTSEPASTDPFSQHSLTNVQLSRNKRSRSVPCSDLDKRSQRSRLGPATLLVNDQTEASPMVRRGEDDLTELSIEIGRGAHPAEDLPNNSTLQFLDLASSQTRPSLGLKPYEPSDSGPWHRSEDTDTFGELDPPNFEEMFPSAIDSSSPISFKMAAAGTVEYPLPVSSHKSSWALPDDTFKSFSNITITGKPTPNSTPLPARTDTSEESWDAYIDNGIKVAKYEHSVVFQASERAKEAYTKAEALEKRAHSSLQRCLRSSSLDFDAVDSKNAKNLVQRLKQLKRENKKSEKLIERYKLRQRDAHRGKERLLKEFLVTKAEVSKKESMLHGLESLRSTVHANELSDLDRDDEEDDEGEEDSESEADQEEEGNDKENEQGIGEDGQ